MAEQKVPRRKYTVVERDDMDLNLKIMLLGDSCTGKTCMLIRFKDGTFLSNNFISTVGIDYRNKAVEIEGKKIKLQIWDTAGQERFRSVTHAYYRDADALLLLFDVTNRESFQNIRSWLGQVKEYAQDSVIVILVGNKVDLSGVRKVQASEAKKLADDYGIGYIETSAKSGHNVREAFIDVATQLKHKRLGSNNREKITLDAADSPRWYSNRCCGYS